MDQQRPDRIQTLEPRVLRVLADNPSPFTYHGTQTYLVGDSKGMVVIDPGPAIDDHIDAIVGALNGAPLLAIACTHTHRDHSPASLPLKARTGAPIIGCAPLVLEDSGPRADASFDPDYAPDRVLTDGEAIEGDGWQLIAVATPGHTSNHLCFGLSDGKALFTGDHVMGWSTTVVSPPDGDMADYMASLEKLMGRDDSIYYPAHGDPVTQPQRFARSLAGHRKSREGQILRLLDEQASTITNMVDKMYVGIDPRLHMAAGRSVLAHLVDLERRGRVVLGEGDIWALAA